MRSRRARSRGHRVGDLRADQEPAQIVGKLVRLRASTKSPAVRTREEAVSSAPGAARRRAERDALRERRVASLAIAASAGRGSCGRAPRRTSRRSCRWRSATTLPPSTTDPFRMRARQEEAPILDAEPRERAEDLRLLAADHVVRPSRSVVSPGTIRTSAASNGTVRERAPRDRRAPAGVVA